MRRARPRPGAGAGREHLLELRHPLRGAQLRDGSDAVRTARRPGRGSTTGAGCSPPGIHPPWVAQGEGGVHRLLAVPELATPGEAGAPINTRRRNHRPRRFGGSDRTGRRAASRPPRPSVQLSSAATFAGSRSRPITSLRNASASSGVNRRSAARTSSSSPRRAAGPTWGDVREHCGQRRRAQSGQPPTGRLGLLPPGRARATPAAAVVIEVTSTWYRNGDHANEHGFRRKPLVHHRAAGPRARGEPLLAAAVADRPTPAGPAVREDLGSTHHLPDVPHFSRAVWPPTCLGQRFADRPGSAVRA